MLDLLVRYAHDHGLTARPGFKPKRVRWALVFDRRGRFLNAQELGDVGEKRNAGRQFPCCPDLSQPEMKAGGVGCRHFLVDTAEVVALHTKGEVNAKLRAKHAYFTDLLKSASTVVPELAAIADELGDPTTLERIQTELRALKAKSTDNVTMALMDEGLGFVADSEAWHQWWDDFRQRLSQKRAQKRRAEASTTNRMRCLASGALVEPALTHPKIEGLADVGGLSMGDALASFKQDAFRSYGLEQSANAAVSEEMAAAYRAALSHLIREHGRRLVGAKVVHWYSSEVSQAQDPIVEIEQGDAGDDDWEDQPITEREADADAQHRARKLLASFATGEAGDLLNYRYYILILSGAAGRVMIRDWFEGQFGALRDTCNAWFDDLAIVHRNGDGLARRPKFMAVLGALVRDLGELHAPLVAKMWRVAVRGEAVPREAMTQSLARSKVDVIQANPPNHARMGLLKAYHVRKGDDFMQPYLNEDHPHPAYHCGRAMAVLAEVQRAALGEVGAGVVERYFAAASSTPALVLGRLVRTSQFHLAGIREPVLRQWFDNRLAGVLAQIKDRVPATLTLEEQSLFALGYYQQKAARLKRESDDSTVQAPNT